MLTVPGVCLEDCRSLTGRDTVALHVPKEGDTCVSTPPSWAQ